MDWLRFGLLLNDNIPLYLWSLLGSFCLYFLIYRKMFISIIDPVMFTVLFSTFGFSVVIFLYLTKSIDTKYLISYLLTQSAFILGFFSYKSLKRSQIVAPVKTQSFESEMLFVNIVFFVCSSLYIIIQLLSYVVVGIPLLSGNHVDIYSNSGGWGILGRFIDVLKPVSIFLLIYYFFKKEVSLFFYLYKYFVLAMVFVFFALAGSRSEFMTIGLIFFCFLILNGDKLKQYFNKIRFYEIMLLSLAMCFVFFTIFFQSKHQEDGASGLSVFLFRLVASGDVYYFAYPNNNIEQISNAHPFLALFGDIFSTLRIVPRQDQPVVIGYQLFQLFGESDTVAGPNSRHNVFGYVYYGFYDSIIFSYVMGLSLSFVRNKLFFVLRRNVLGQILFVFLYMQIANIETDPQMVVSNLENVFLIFPVILLISLSAFALLFKSKNKFELLT